MLRFMAVAIPQHQAGTKNAIAELLECGAIGELRYATLYFTV
jgi:hypothetical protein